MAGVLLARILNVTLHMTILGGLVDVDLQVHNGRVLDALTHTAVISVCILVFAIAGYIATKLLSKSTGNLRIEVTRVPMEDPKKRTRRNSRKPVVQTKPRSRAKR